MNDQDIAKKARREGMEEAADIVVAESDKLRRAAEKECRKFYFEKDVYEQLENTASHFAAIGRKILRRANRS